MSEKRPYALGDAKTCLLRLLPQSDTIYINSGRTVLATDRQGFINNHPDHGLLVHETRLLSRYRYRIDQAPLYPVSNSNVTPSSWCGYYITPGPCGRKGDAFAAELNETAQQSIELMISRFATEGFHEDIRLTNFTRAPAKLKLILELDSDFADQHETHGARIQHGRKRTRWSATDSGWEWRADYRATHRFSHQGRSGKASLSRGLAVRFSNATSPPRFVRKLVSFDISLEPHACWRCCVDHVPIIEGRELGPRYRCRSLAPPDNEYDRRRAVFLREATSFSSRESNTLAPVVAGALEQGKLDLAALRLFDLDRNDRAWLPAAGLPHYVALFGRDALTASWEAAPVATDIMQGTLSVLAAWQGNRRDDWRDERPGRMLHEAHTGPLATLNYIPQGRNYSSVTTSGFYPFVVAQLWHWTGDKERVRPFIDPAVAALRWLRDAQNRHGDVFFKYKTRSRQGNENQGWKDSGDAIVHEDGSRASAPLATCEEQGIVFAAQMNLAEVLWWFDRKDEAKELFRQATDLKKRFNDAFWMEEKSCFAMALDADDRQVRSIGSNALHCIATGIADKALVPRCLERLFAPDMFSGWGVRTLSSSHPAFNPYSYHRGTVWPVEQGPFAVGAYRYGCHGDVERICRSQFETASLFEHYRLPECICGHQRDEDHPFPAVYPLANSPQAWSATTVYTLMQAMLGLQPFAPLKMLFVDPFLPAWLPELTISGMRVADAIISVRFFRRKDGSSDYEILEKDGALHVMRQPSPWSFTATMRERAGDVLTSLFH